MEILITGKCLRNPHWKLVNKTEYHLERYRNYNTIFLPDKLIFGNFNDEPKTTNYYNFLSDDDVNRIPITPFDDDLPDNKGVEDAVMPNN